MLPLLVRTNSTGLCACQHADLPRAEHRAFLRWARRWSDCCFSGETVAAAWISGLTSSHWAGGSPASCSSFSRAASACQPAMAPSAACLKHAAAFCPGQPQLLAARLLLLNWGFAVLDHKLIRSLPILQRGLGRVALPPPSSSLSAGNAHQLATGGQCTGRLHLPCSCNQLQHSACQSFDQRPPVQLTADCFWRAMARLWLSSLGRKSTT